MVRAVDIDVAPAVLSEILPLREHYRHEMQCQIVHDSLHARHFTDPYLFRLHGEVAGYGCVLGFDPEPKDVIKEFYLLPGRRAEALPIFRQLIAVSGARRVEAQTNDVLLALMLLDCAREITSDTILFADAITTRLVLPGASFRRVTPADEGRIFEHHAEPVGGWAIEAEGIVVATGGFLLHYNEPWADLHMEVAAPVRRRGYGSYLLQELKRACHEAGRRPAARCQAANAASRAALQRAGMLPCARIMAGVIER